MYVRCMKITSILLIIVLVHIAYPSTALAGDSPEEEAKFAEKLKSEIAKLGTGPDAQVEVKLRDKTKLKGYISEVSDESFTVVDGRSGSARTVTYPQVKQVKGNNLVTGAKILITIGIVLVIALIFASCCAQ